MHWCWNKCAPVSDVLNSLSLTGSSGKQQLRPCQPSQSKVIPSLGKRDSLPTRHGVVGRCERPFHSEGQRDHPSADLLRIFMACPCHSGCSLAGLLRRSPRWQKKKKIANNTSSVPVRGYSSDKETVWGMHLHPDVAPATYTSTISSGSGGRHTVITSLSEWIPSGFPSEYWSSRSRL